MTFRYAAAVSEHPLAAHAVAEVVGAVLERLEAEPDVACLFVTSPFVDAVEDVAGAVRQLLRPGVLMGAAASTIVGGPREIEDGAAISLWAARIGPVEPLRWDASSPPALPPSSSTLRPRVAVVVTDPFSISAETLVDEMATADPALKLVGGLASAARGAGGNRLILDNAVHRDGAVGFLLPATAPISTVVSQGCRPLGRPFVVTRSEGHAILELAGKSAVTRLGELIDAASPDDRALMTRGLQIGRVIDEHKLDFGPGDFVVRALLGADRASGAVIVGESVPIGTTVQFHVRDAESATEDLEHLLAARRADAALLFTCNARGTPLFGVADHDAALVHDRTGSTATAGMACAGELGPVGVHNFVHGYTASVLLLGEGAD